MSTTTKSPLKVLVVAYRTAKRTLPAYRHRFSPKKFTQHQLFACLVLKTFMKSDYRGIVAHLIDSPDLSRRIGLKHIPHFTTLQKAAAKLLCQPIANQLLTATVRTLKKPSIPLAAVDSTGLEAGHVSRYFVRRKRSKQLEMSKTSYYRHWPKLAIVCDCHNHMILSAITTRGPSVDVNQFRKTLNYAVETFTIQHILADAGYDSESNHRYARDEHHIITTIPPKLGRPQLTPKPCKGKYREMMRTAFNKKTYGQRWQVETVFSMIKRNFGDTINARNDSAQCREMMLLVLTHNIAILLLVNELFYRATYTFFPIDTGTKAVRINPKGIEKKFPH